MQDRIEAHGSDTQQRCFSIFKISQPLLFAVIAKTRCASLQKPSRKRMPARIEMLVPK